MVKKLSEMIFPFGSGSSGSRRNDDDEDEKRGAWGGRRLEQFNGLVQQRRSEDEDEDDEIQEDAVEGQYLFVEFLNDRAIDAEMDLGNVSLPENIAPIPSQQVNQWIIAGRELRFLADAFARSRQREIVRRRAEQVSEDVNLLNKDNFFDLLQELFNEGGITRERILVLFFFCADVALEALRRRMTETFSHLMNWSLEYISTRVAAWVHRHGGWGTVLRSSLDIIYHVAACCAFVAVVAACVIYIRRNI